MKTIESVMESTGQKKGVVEKFRFILLDYGILKKNKNLDQRAFETFKKAIEYKENENSTWEESMQRAVQEEYGEELQLPFEWNQDIILKNLIWQIKQDKITVEHIPVGINDEFHIVYELMIPNFSKLGENIPAYKNSRGTDGNPVTTFICKGDDYVYYVVGKYNSITKLEDVHIFYHDGLAFNIMRCKHICGGNSNKGRLETLWQVCSSKINYSI